MKIDIENYRGWEITFDPDKDEFYAYSNSFDQEKVKKGLHNLRDYIDNFIKDNQEFKPFNAMKYPGGHGDPTIRVIGIRKDNRFVYEVSGGQKKQLPEYNERDYFVPHGDVSHLFEEYEQLDRQEKEIYKRKLAIKDRITSPSLAKYKKDHFGQ